MPRTGFALPALRGFGSGHLHGRRVSGRWRRAIVSSTGTELEGTHRGLDLGPSADGPIICRGLQSDVLQRRQIHGGESTEIAVLEEVFMSIRGDRENELGIEIN